jgi:hypothetical protein
MRSRQVFSIPWWLAIAITVIIVLVVTVETIIIVAQSNEIDNLHEALYECNGLIPYVKRKLGIAEEEEIERASDSDTSVRAESVSD